MRLKLRGTKVLRRLLNSKKNIVVNRGGTRSSKTYSILQMIIKWLFTGEMRKGEYLMKGKTTIVRKHSTTIKHTVLSDFIDILKDNGLFEDITYHKTDRELSYNGRVVKFMGADDQQKLRGYKSNFLYCNEANELGYEKEFFQLRMRTTHAIFIDFNPSDPYIWINEELEQKRLFHKGDVEVIVSTYLDNQKNLTKRQIEDIEYLKVTSPDLWKVYGLGEYGLVKGLIISNIIIIDDILPVYEYSKAGSGMDYGFVNDYTAHYDCSYVAPKNRHERGKLFVDQIIYDLGMDGTDIRNRLLDLNYSKTKEIFADSAQPGTSNIIRKGGFNIKSAYKFKDSISWGVDMLRSMDIYVTARSQGFIREQKLYKFKEDKDGKTLNVPIDANNHAFDAVRYYLNGLHYNGNARIGKTKYIN